MAEMIPEYLPDHATQGERAVFAALQELPPEMLVFYEPIIKRRYPDFIVIDPQAGILVIEVKGWRAGWIQEANRNDIRIRQAGNERVDDHPVHQARKYQDRLMSLCQAHPHGRLLRTPQGKFNCAFGHAAILTGISRQALRERGLDAVFPAGSTLCSDEWEAAQSAGPDALRRALHRAFDPEIPCRSLSTDQVSLLRSLIHPVVRLDTLASGPASGAAAAPEDIRLLDFEQERGVRDMRSGHRVIYGVAGSGKTVILIARAKLLAEDEGRQILVLCFNVPLAEHLSKALSPYSNVTVSSFGQWGRQQHAPVNLVSQEDFGQGLLARLECGEGDAGRFDAVLIDEGQDFPASWFRCAVAALKDPVNSDLVIAYDMSQNLYKRPPVSWSPLGVRIQGGKGGSRTTQLAINYRNTKEIIAAACTFALPPSAGDDDAPQSVAADIEAAKRHGPWPVVLKVPGRDAMIAQCAAIAEQIGQDGYPASGIRFTAATSDIRIIYPKDEGGLQAKLQQALQAKSLGAVRLSTVYKAKGLQSKVVILAGAEQLPSQSPERDEQAERAAFYVALTRPEDLLIVLYTHDTPYISELLRNIARFGGEEHV